MAIPSEQETLEMLDKERKIPVRIKSDKNNPNYVTEAVIVNGVWYQVEVGQEVEVPETVYRLLLRKGVI